MDGGVQKEHVLESRAYRVEDIARILGIGRSSAYALVKQGHFKTIRVGKSIRVSRKSFDNWFDNQNDQTL